MSDPRVLRHVVDSILPCSRSSRDAARAALAGAGTPMLQDLAGQIAGAQHAPRPRVARRIVLVACGDHGAGDPGIRLGPDDPTVVAARAIAAGTAAVADVARTARAPIVLVDAGTRESAHMPPSAIALGRGPSRDLRDEPAMTIVDAASALEAGIALCVSLTEDGLDVLALGALGTGSDLASAAVLGASLGRAPALASGDADVDAAAVLGAGLAHLGALDRLAAVGGPDTAVLAGVVLAAASMHLPVILDGHATGAAALAATWFAPEVAGYLIAAHRGTLAHPAILDHLGLVPVFDVGLGHGEGTGAAMVLPLVDQVAALSQQR